MTKSKSLTNPEAPKVFPVTKRTITAKTKELHGFMEAMDGLDVKKVGRAAAAGAVIAEVTDLLVKAGKGAPMSKKAWLAMVGIQEMTANKWKRVHLITTAHPRIAEALPQQIEKLAQFQQAIEKDTKFAAKLEKAIGTDGKIVDYAAMLPKKPKPDAERPEGQGQRRRRGSTETRASNPRNHADGRGTRNGRGVS